MRTPARLAAAVTGLLLSGQVVPASGSALGGAGPIDEAREASRRVPFSARVEVAWVDGSGVHTAELGVRAVGGSVRVQGPVGAGGAGAFTTELHGDGLSLPSGRGPGEGEGVVGAALERKYELVSGPGPTVAGRQTEQVVLRRGGQVRERLAIDTATGLVLQREVFGPDGRPIRVVRVLQLDTAPVADTVAVGARRAGPPRRLRLSGLSPAYPAPAGLPGGYRRVAAYRHDRVVHLVYTDGLHGLSLFSQPGELRPATGSHRGETVRVGRSAGLRYTWAGGEVVTWEAGTMVHTLVGDGAAEDLMAAARSLPRPKGPSLLGRVRATARLVTELVSGGR